MRSVKRLVFVMTGGLFFAAGWFATSIVIDKNHGTASDSKQLKIEALEREIEIAKKTNIYDPENIHTIEHSSTPLGKAPSTTTHQPNQKIVLPEETESAQKDTIPTVPFTSTLAGIFATEPTDDRSFLEYTLRLQSQISVDAPLLGAEFKSARCKSTTCEVTVSTNIEARDQLEKLSQDLGAGILIKQRDFFEPNIMTVYSKEEKVMRFYFSKTNTQAPTNILLKSTKH